ncbi:MAG TPA: flavin reductase family protein [Rhodanobacteraceae bacterium]|nr:flavin reductase family protein [Rhodanobacteraceae bacterium]
MSAEAKLAHAIDPHLFRRVMGRFATGVTVVSFLREGKPAGMTVNAFLSVSLTPPLILVSVRKTSSFVEHVRVGSRCGVNILSETQRKLGPHFANHPEQDVDVHFQDHAGTPLLDGSLAQIVARVVDIHPAGDHLLFIAEIEHLAYGPDAQPLIFFSGRYKQIHAHDPIVQWHAEDGW